MAPEKSPGLGSPVIHERGGMRIAELRSGGVLIGRAQDALDVMADLGARGIRELILHKENLSADFFRLRTGIAGEILQKFSNYGVRAAIVGDFERHPSESLEAFIRESNRGGALFFVSTVEAALARLAGPQWRP
jgi:hypothetical protein